MSCQSELSQSVSSPTKTGTKPKSKLARLATAKFSPKKQPHQQLPSTSNLEKSFSPMTQITNQNNDVSNVKSDCKSSPRRYHHSDDIQRQILKQTPASSPKRSPKRLQNNINLTGEEEIYEMGLAYEPSPITLAEEPAMSFLEFESLYNLEKELGQARQETIAELDEKCIFGGWFGTRRGVYTELPEPARSFEWMSRVTSGQTGGASQIPSEGFSFAPGWSISAQHFYQWHQRGKSIQQVRFDVPIFSYSAFYPGL
uniref:Uncharacterized protein n=1 Tax=Bracon brevicornis TaxID=1563983 RepID=A0A6V7JU58_9HYME